MFARYICKLFALLWDFVMESSSSRKHTKVESDTNTTTAVNLFTPDGGPLECTLLVFVLLEIEELLQMCQVSKYLHACVRASTKRDAMITKCALKWLRIPLDVVNGVNSVTDALALATTRGIFPITISDVPPRATRYSGWWCEYGLHYAFTPASHPGELSFNAWDKCVPQLSHKNDRPASHLHDYLVVYLNETVFSTKRKHINQRTQSPFALSKILFEYDAGCQISFNTAPRKRVNKERYRAVIKILIHTEDKDTDMHPPSIVTDYSFEIEDILKGAIWSKLNNPEWLKTRPLQFTSAWWGKRANVEGQPVE